MPLSIDRCLAAARMRLCDQEGEALGDYAIVLTVLTAGAVAATGVLTGKLGGWIESIGSVLS